MLWHQYYQSHDYHVPTNSVEQMEQASQRIENEQKYCRQELSRLAASGGEWDELCSTLRLAESLGLHLCENRFRFRYHGIKLKSSSLPFCSGRCANLEATYEIQSSW